MCSEEKYCFLALADKTPLNSFYHLCSGSDLDHMLLSL